MNFLSHPYVAFKIFGRLSPELVEGSLLNDLAFFVPKPAFSFEEIHEGGEVVFNYLRAHRLPTDLALGMLAHGVTLGADSFSRTIEREYGSTREKLVEEILLVSPNISREIASRGRFHNYLWWGVDVQILKHYPEFAKKVRDCLRQLDLEKINRVLADCFQKDPADVQKNLTFFFTPIKENDFHTVSDLVKIWQAAVSGLPEKDEVSLPAGVKLFNECALIVKGRWQIILEEVISTVKKNLCQKKLIR